MNERNNNRIVYERIVVTATITCQTALHVGGIDTPKAIEKERQITTEKESPTYAECIHRNNDNNNDVSETDFYIPANTINGFIRRLATSYFDESINLLLGAEKSVTDRIGGKLSISRAYRLANNDKVKPSVKSGWHDNRKTLINTYTRIDNRLGGNEHEHLYHIELHPIGSTFELQLVAHYLSDNELQILIELLQLWENNSDYALASHKTKSWGITKLSNICIEYYECQAVAAYILDGTAITAKQCPYKSNEETKPPEATACYKLTFTTEQPLLINDTNRVSNGDANIKGTPKKHYYQNSNNEIVIPAKTLAGVLRAQVRKYTATQELGDGTKADDIRIALETADKVVAEIFGGEQQSSCLRFEDAVLEDNKEYPEHLQTLVPIDRITGAACQGQGSKSVFSVKALTTGLTFTTNIYLFRELKAEHKKLVQNVISRLCATGLWLGGDKARGFGLLSLSATDGKGQSVVPDKYEDLPINNSDNKDKSEKNSIQRKELKAIYNPYAMVSIAEKPTTDDKLKYPKTDDFTSNLRHDIDLPNYYSGVLRCQLTTMTDVFVGAGVDSTQPYSANDSKTYLHYQRGDELAFPASSLRGMIGSVMETISQSRLRVVENKQYSMRKEPEKALKTLGRYVIKDGKPFIQQVKHYQTSLVDRSKYKDGEKIFFKKTGTKVNIFKKDSNGAEKGFLRLMDLHGSEQKNKSCDLVIQEINKPLIPIKSSALDTFETLLKEAHENLQKEGKDVARPASYKKYSLEEGQIVYFDVNAEGTEVTDLSYAAIWRKPYEVPNTYQALPEAMLPWGEQKTDLLSPAEALLGVVEEGKNEQQKNLASRLRFTDAVSSCKLKEQSQAITLKALSTPKLPSPHMYFSKDRKLNGRKQYLRQQYGTVDNYPVYQSRSDDNLQLKVRCKPILANESTTFDIHFHNLNEDELKLLTASISPNESFQHKLGLGKPLGLGSVKLAIQSVKLLNTSGGEKEKKNIVRILEGKEGNGNYVDNDTLNHLCELGKPITLSDGMLNYPLTKEQLKAYKNSNISANEEELYKWHEENKKNPKNLKNNRLKIDD